MFEFNRFYIINNELLNNILSTLRNYSSLLDKFDDDDEEEKDELKSVLRELIMLEEVDAIDEHEYFINLAEEEYEDIDDLESFNEKMLDSYLEHLMSKDKEETSVGLNEMLKNAGILLTSKN